MQPRRPAAIDRRSFLASVSAAIAAPALAGRAAPRDDGPAPRIALIGCGGRGAENLGELLGAGAAVVALCDVDRSALAAATARIASAGGPSPATRGFADLRELLARRDEFALDGVLVSTPDHVHAFATALALRARLPVYCEKPLTRTMEESRRLLELSDAARVPTQMGTQIHATENYRRVVELIRAGAIGTVTSCDCWVNKGWCCGTTGPVVAPPDGLDYGLWLGPAQATPYVEGLHPANWRRYWAFGSGTLGDMGCHMLDLPVWALGLDRATLGEVEVRADCPAVDAVGCPEWTEATWAIARTGPEPSVHGGIADPLVLRWFDGGRISPTAQELGAKDRFDYHGRFNVVFQGTKGFLWANYGEHLLTPGVLEEEPRPAVARIAPSPGHHREWLDAIRRWKLGETGAHDAPPCAFRRATVLNELVLSGTVAARAGRPLRYDFRTQRFAGGDPIPTWHPEPRDGWSLSDADLDHARRVG